MSQSSTNELHRGFLLHSRPYRDSSLLVEFFSEEHGRVGLVARGVRSGKAAQRGLLQPFRPLLASWGGRGELGSLRSVEADGPPRMLHGAALMSGFYLNELLLRLLHRNDPHPELYPLYRAVLEMLAVEEDPEPVLRVFEKRLLEGLGYGLQLSRDVHDDEPVVPDERYHYQLERGPVPSRLSDGQGVPIRGASLLALEAEQLDSADVLRDAKRLMRAILDLHIGQRPLKTREVLQQMSGRY